MGRQNWRASNMLYPVPAVLVGCRDENGKDNLMTAAWAGTVCSDPVMVSVSIRKERYSHDIIEQTGEFTLSLTTNTLAYATDYCGVRSGRDRDKFSDMKLTPLESSKISELVDQKKADKLDQQLQGYMQLFESKGGSFGQ